MITAGIDYGVRRVAMVFASGEGEDIYRVHELVLHPKEYPTGEANDGLALATMHRQVFAWCCWYAPDLVVIESPIQGVSVNVKVGLRLAQASGALAVACSRAGSSTLSAGPTEWKKAITGHGNADKGQITEWLRLNRPELSHLCASQDAVDAACMALYAQDVLGR